METICLNSACEEQCINHKPVYVVGNHADAFYFWSKVRCSLGVPPLLLTLDYHTDTHRGFLGHLFLRYNNGSLISNKKVPEREYDKIISNVDINSLNSISTATKKLKNDEQIDAAIKCGIINHAFVISYSMQHTRSIEEDRYIEDCSIKNRLKQNGVIPAKPIHPLTYKRPCNGIFIIEKGFPVGSTEKVYTDEYTRTHHDQAIESEYLCSKLSVIGEMSKAIDIADILNEKYILDIDLDYFRTNKSMNPNNADVFYMLIHKADVLTIALEPQFVEELRLDNNIDANKLRLKLMDHIMKALN